MDRCTKIPAKATTAAIARDAREMLRRSKVQILTALVLQQIGSTSMRFETRRLARATMSASLAAAR